MSDDALKVEIIKRALALLERDGLYCDAEQREMLINGRSRYAIILVGLYCATTRREYITVYYDTPRPIELCTDNPDMKGLDEWDRDVGEMVVAVFRGMMVLDDLANA